MPQTATDWRPTPKQVAVLNAAAESGLNRTISAVCEQARVHRRTFYRWIDDDPQFRAEWDHVWRGSLRRHMPGIVAAQIAKALDGDTRAAELLVKLAGVTNPDATNDNELGAIARALMQVDRAVN